MRIRKLIASQALAGVMSLALTGHALALDLHVAPNGKDTNPATEAKPLATLAAAHPEKLEELRSLLNKVRQQGHSAPRLEGAATIPN